jgi:hypothetical protein
MGFFRRKSEERAPALLEDQLADWEAQDAYLADLIDWTREFRGFAPSELEERPPVAFKAGERVFMVAKGAILVEPRSSGGHWVGRTQGVSFHVPGTRSTRYRIGANKGHYVREPEKPTRIDTGIAAITDRRVAFAGVSQAREWVWTKVLAVEHQDNPTWTAIPVSNRQKVSGLAYDADQAGDIRLCLDLAQAVATDTVDMLVADLEAERTEWASHRPTASVPPPAI